MEENQYVTCFRAGEQEYNSLILSRPLVALIGPNAACMFALLLRRFGDIYFGSETGFMVLDGKDWWFEVKGGWVRQEIGLIYAAQAVALKTLDECQLIEFQRLLNPARRAVRITDEITKWLLEEDENDEDLDKTIGYAVIRSSGSIK